MTTEVQLQLQRKAKEIWDKFDTEETNLPRLFDYLKTKWYSFLRDAAALYGFDLQGRNHAPKAYITYINGQLNTKKTAAWDVNKIYNSYFHDFKDLPQEIIKDNQLLKKKGYDEGKLKEFLKNMSVFMSEISGCGIPQRIMSYEPPTHPGPGRPTPPPPQGPEIDEEDLIECACDIFPVVFIIDTSTPMRDYLQDLKEGLTHLIGLLHNDEVLLQKVVISVMTTSQNPELLDFTRVDKPDEIIERIKLNPCFSPARMTNAIQKASDKIIKQVHAIIGAGVDAYCPWIIIISNGRWNKEYNKDINEVAEMVREKVNLKSFKIYIRSLTSKEAMSQSQRENIEKFDDNFEEFTHANDFFDTAFQSMCGIKQHSPSSSGDGMELSNSNGI